VNLSTTERRTILRGALLLAPVACFTLVVRPYRTALAEVRERTRVEADALARERGAVAMAARNPALQRLTDSMLQVTTPRLFSGRDDVMASSELAAYLGRTAEQHRVWMVDATTRPGVLSPAGVRTLRVDLRAESDFEGLLDFLQALEQGDRVVRIERLDVSQALSRVGNEEAETLTIVATVSGFALPNPSLPTPLRDTVARQP
jgi:hypothetical protein